LARLIHVKSPLTYEVVQRLPLFACTPECAGSLAE
jgi:hypothetical protein